MVDASQPVASYLFNRTHLLFLFLLMPSMADSQNPGWWSDVDTVTRGDCDDTHPVIVHNAFFFSAPDVVQMVFERRTASESQIVAKQFNTQEQTWDTTDVVISRSPIDEPQTRPSYAEIFRSAYPTSYLKQCVVWQRGMGGHWQLCFSMRDSQATWAFPTVLSSDSVDLTDARIVPSGYNDSTFLVTWKRANTILMARLGSLGMSQPDTLCVCASDTIQYDICNREGYIDAVWTSGSPPAVTLLSRSRDRGSGGSWTLPETTLSHLTGFPNPNLIVGYGASPLFIEMQMGNSREVLFYSSWSGTWGISDDSTADDCNAQAFQAPVITKPAVSDPISYPYLDALAYEKYRGSDSMLVFIGRSFSDTVHSQGHNRNVCVGSQLWWGSYNNHILMVWESNRSGRSHIYSRVARIIIDEVNEPAVGLAAFALHQNYPNPFNPVTTLQYSIGAVSHEPLIATKVRLAVYDMLGREVAVLVNEGKQPGTYGVSFDGAGLASGVYLCRLTAGGYTASRRMVLLR
jgi:hypothetical protein